MFTKAATFADIVKMIKIINLWSENHALEVFRAPDHVAVLSSFLGR